MTTTSDPTPIPSTATDLPSEAVNDTGRTSAIDGAASASEGAAPQADDVSADMPRAALQDPTADAPQDPTTERRRLEAELAAIEKKREELARALVVNAHPELADPIRMLTGRLYAVTRIEERMREPLSKAEVRKVESLGKKRESLVAKRAELDAKRAGLEAEMTEIDRELAQLGEQRTQGFERERTEALEQLVVTLAQLGPVFEAAGADPVQLVAGLGPRLPEVQLAAEELATRPSA